LEEIMSDSLTLAHSQPPPFLKLLAHDLRWRVLRHLAFSDHRVQELMQMLGEPQNLVSYHLRKLREGELVYERRSSHDGRDVYYSIDLRKLRTLYSAAGEALHPALGGGVEEDSQLKPAADTGAGDLPPTRILFLCTHNSARSQMAEAITRHHGASMVEVFSAGTEPSGIHPYALRVLSEMNVDVSGARSKHLDEYGDDSFDYVITVCDKVRETCPLFPGDPEQIHWSFADPAAVEGEGQYGAFVKTAQELTTRIRFLILVIQNERQNRRRSQGHTP
jgi:ArsR family transcriptional regulator, arsenate/arsenite/antimonite-responsive transcriptional repressor / arsenate reductase (thioredoxin)